MGMKDVGTLKELGVCVGDVVEWMGTYMRERDYVEYTIGSIDKGVYRAVDSPDYLNVSPTEPFRIVSRASDTPKLWRDMTAEEKGALLLAAHEGLDIEYWRRGSGGWASCPSASIYDNESYRIKPEPKVETVKVMYPDVPYSFRCDGGIRGPTHKITFNLIDGKPDCASVKMEPLV